jgi:acetylornithine deacetylase/succinyl-diaminopimelate desuccinylase family protein
MMSQKDIENYIKDQCDDICKLLCELIAIPTVNPPGQSYRQCVDYLCSKLKEYNISHQVIEVSIGDYPRYSILGGTSAERSTLHLHGHYDVVPAQAPDQFVPRVHGNRIYGRGSSDMKGGLVVLLFALRIVKECFPGIDGQISFSLVPDEETSGLLGTKYLTASNILPTAAYGMLMPEPTSGAIWHANKGALTYRITVRGKSAHVGLVHRGINAFESMITVTQSLLELNKSIQERKTILLVREPEASGSVMLLGGMASSGTVFNVVPEVCAFTIDRRINPEESLQEAEAELMEVFESHRRKGIQIEVETLQREGPSYTSPNTKLGETLEHAIQKVTGGAPSFEMCPGVLEIRHFNNRGMPAYAYGPGSLDVSHGPEEYVNIDDLLNCLMVYVDVAARLTR